MRLLRARRVRGLEEHWHGAMPDDFLKPTDATMRVSPPCHVRRPPRPPAWPSDPNWPPTSPTRSKITPAKVTAGTSRRSRRPIPGGGHFFLVQGPDGQSAVLANTHREPR